MFWVAFILFARLIKSGAAPRSFRRRDNGRISLASLGDVFGGNDDGFHTTIDALYTFSIDSPTFIANTPRCKNISKQSSLSSNA